MHRSQLMKRCTVIGAGGLLLAGQAGLAKRARKLYRIGIVSFSPVADFAGTEPLRLRADELIE